MEASETIIFQESAIHIWNFDMHISVSIGLPGYNIHVHAIF